MNPAAPEYPDTWKPLRPLYDCAPSSIAPSQAEVAILAHNDEMQQMCRSRYTQNACSYRDHDGKKIYPPRTCSECPENYKIEWPVSATQTSGNRDG